MVESVENQQQPPPDALTNWHAAEVRWFNRSAHTVSKNEDIAKLMTYSCESLFRGDLLDGCECCGELNSSAKRVRGGLAEWKAQWALQVAKAASGDDDWLHKYHTSNLQRWKNFISVSNGTHS